MLKKGIISVILGMYLANTVKLPVLTNTYISIIAIAVVWGHDYTPFLKFKGGKGVNTALGTFILVAPIPTLIGVAVHFILRLFTSDECSIFVALFGKMQDLSAY